MRKIFVLTTCMVVIFLSACNRSTVNLDFTNAKGEIQQLQNLVFRFDKGLVPDSILNQWDSTAYISFEPKIEGKFRWENPDELVFSPSRPLPPATSFKAKFHDDILQHSEFGRIGETDEVNFHTPSLKLEQANVTWVLADERSNNAVPQVDMYFNYSVKPESIKDKLLIEVQGKQVAFNVQTLSIDSRVSVRLAGLTPTDKDLDAKITLSKGLVPEGGRNGTEEELALNYIIPSPFNLIVNDVSAQHDGAGGMVIVRTSQQVIADNLASNISFSPAVKFSVQPADDGFIIQSENFDASKSYLLTLSKGIRGRIGGVLREESDHNIAFGELQPSISFVNSKAVYLSSQGNELIEMRIVNVPKVKVIISKIYESNLRTAQRYGYYPVDRMSDQEDYYYYDASNDVSMGDVIYEQEIDTRSLPKFGDSRLFKMNVEDRLPDFKGIYHIKVRSTQDYWISDSRFISKTDIGLIAKEGREKMIVFANSIRNAESLSGVNIIVYGNNNQVLGNGVTDASGVAEVAYSRKEFAGFKPAMIIAKTENDFNYLPFSSTAVNTSRFEVGGKRVSSTGLDAFIYEERDIYRPGETINFSVIVRDLQWKSPGELPVKMKMLLPNGKELKNFRKNLNAQGSLESSIDISPSAITGSYTLEVYTSNDVLLASKAFSVEEFVPDRIKVTTKLDDASLQPGGSTTLRVNAVNFFGPPAANRNYEAEIQVRPKAFTSAKYNNYDFSIRNEGISFDKVVRQGKTDENGNASEQYEVPSMFRNTGLLQARFFATVFDETGRPVSRSASADIFTQDVFFGIADDGYWYYPLNQPVRFPVIAMNKNQSVVNGAKAEVTVIKHEYRTVLTRSGSYFRYDSQKDDKIISKQNLTISGDQTLYSFIPRSPGDYEIRVAVPGASSYVSKQFYSYGYWGGDNSSFQVNTEGNIDIELDKSSYYTGENARILFKTPFSGRMLVTIETDKVLSHQYINVDKRTASLDLKLSTEHLPNVFVTATLIKPHVTSDIPLTVARGFQNIRLEEKQRKMPVAITAQKTTRSRTHHQVKVKAAPNSYVTLAAVDNGVLQVTNYKTADPYEYFYASRALQVNAYDLYPLLFPELNARTSSTGGDGSLEMDKRVNPMPAKRIKIVSYWSGIKKANASGEAVFEFDIPAFSGQVRMMAIAYKDELFGNSEATMTVADPIVLSTALPRFLSPNDTVTVPVTVTNTTATPMNAVATISTTGPLKAAGASKQTVQLASNAEQRVVFNLVASPTVSVGKVKIEVQGGSEKYIDETEISVRPASPLQVLTGSGSVTGGGSHKINIATSDFMDAGLDYKLVIGRSPVIDLGKQISYLIQYPYGCTEQVISSVFPQLYFNDLAAQMQIKDPRRYNSNENVQEAIRKIQLRQLYNGGLTLWDGEGTEHWWTSIYAAHFLLEAKKAGFEVEPRLLDGLLSYINQPLRNSESIIYYYNRDQQKKIAPKEVAYSLYVLALAARPNVSVMNYYKANTALLALDSRYLLSVTYAIAGDKKRFKEVLPDSFSGEVAVPQTGGSFYSDIRDEAVALNALIDADPGNNQIPIMARHVSDKLKQRPWFSTQEAAFSFLALGKLARTAANSSVSAEVRVNGKKLAMVNDNTVTLTKKQLNGSTIELVTSGTGRMYYYWQSEGISETGAYKAEDSYIKVRRKFFDRYGREISGNTFKQNDLVIVEVTLSKSYSGTVQNIVIADLIPAGFEIENPRTKEIPGMDWIKDGREPLSIDVRDDRINLFVDLHANQQKYYYAVRAVSPGKFRMGPISADAMYNGEYHSYHGAGMIEVVE